MVTYCSNWKGQMWTEQGSSTSSSDSTHTWQEQIQSCTGKIYSLLWWITWIVCEPVQLRSEVKSRPKMLASAMYKLLYSKENKQCSTSESFSRPRAGLVSRNPGNVLTSPAAMQLPQQFIRAWAYLAFPAVTQTQGRAQGLDAAALGMCMLTFSWWSNRRALAQISCRHHPTLPCMGRWICSPTGRKSFIFPKTTHLE